MSKTTQDQILSTRDLIAKAIANNFDSEPLDREAFIALACVALGLAFDLNRIADSLEEIVINTKGRP